LRASRFRWSNSKPGAAKQPPVDPRPRAVDGHRTDGFRIVGRRAYAADNGIAKALLPHGLKAGEQQARADAALSRAGLDTGRAENVATRRVRAGESHDPTLPDCDEAGDGLARERDLGLTGPAVGEILAHPCDDVVFLRGQSAPYPNLLLAQPLEGSAGVGQV